MNNIEKQVNEDLDDLMGHNLLKKINNENFDEDEPKSNKRNVLVKIITVLVPVLILALYFGVNRDFSNNTYSTTEKQYAVYQLASNAGFDGTYEEWIESISGDNIELRILNSEVQWKLSSADGDSWVKLYDINEYSGEDGKDGLTAYEVWLTIEGNDGSKEKFFESLSAYGIWLMQEGNEGKTEEEFLESLTSDGDAIAKTVYELYKSLGYKGTFAEWEDEFIDNNGEFTFDFVKEEFYVSFKNGLRYTVKDGELVPTFPTVDEKQHYEFDGWYYGDLKWNPNTTVVKTNITLEAIYKAVDYQIEYVNLDGKVFTNNNPETFNIDGNILLQNPIVEGYDFNGWKLTNNSSVNVETLDVENLSEYLIEGKLSLSANLTPITYGITYDLNGGENDAKNVNSFVYGSAPFTLYEPTKEGYEFAGWRNSNGIIVTEVTPVANDIVLTAIWSAVTHDITYVLNEGQNNDSNPKTITSEQLVYLYEPTKEGHIFTGWLLNGNKVLVLSSIKSDITLEASWQVEVYNIYYELDGGINDADNRTTYEYGSGVVSLSVPTKEGYRFTGWLIAGKDVTELKDITSDVTLTATWEINQYNITYFLNEGQNNGLNPETITSEQLVYLYEPTKEGYRFTGWLREGNKVILLVNETDDIELTATWETIDYKITYDLDGGVNNTSNPTSITCEEVVPLLEPTKNGYRFDGWTNGGNPSTKLEYIKNDVTLTATWSEIRYTIEYDLDGGKATGNPDEVFITTTATLNDATKTGYTFAGWYTENNLKITKIENVSSNMKLTAKWEAIPYTITYELNDGFNYYYNPTKITIEEEVILNPAVREHYVFNGWYVDNEQITELNAVSSSMILTARWTAIEYDIVYGLDGGTNHINNKDTLNASSSSVQLNAPTKTGYDFGGWYKDAGFGGVQVTSVSLSDLVNGQITIYAKWYWTIYKENDVEYFYYGTYPQSLATGITGGKTDGDIIIQNGEKYEYYNKKYFLYEPIKWKIVSSQSSSKKNVTSDLVLDTVIFDSISSSFAGSYIESYLSNDFYDLSFATAGNEISIESIALPSKNDFETYKTQYGNCGATDFAVEKGVIMAGYGAYWWTSSSFESSVYVVSSAVNGSTIGTTNELSSKNGVRPQLTITI